MRRWPSRYPTTGINQQIQFNSIILDWNLKFRSFLQKGVISLKYNLPKYPSEGYWTIRVEAMSQIHDHQIIVERFYYRFFDVSLKDDIIFNDFDQFLLYLKNGRRVYPGDTVGSGLRFRFGWELFNCRDDIFPSWTRIQGQHHRPSLGQTGQRIFGRLPIRQTRFPAMGKSEENLQNLKSEHLPPHIDSCFSIIKFHFQL